mmetsp:Transcript_16662/g.27004  ORF Transcript_16662/g.27004 Transcript_16662/m.27004 type:complete len:181 (+) Transcript_16662:342-884(+)
MSVNHSWNQFMLNTLDNKYVQHARHGADWRHVHGVIYESNTGEVHTCDHTCIRWVFRRSDKLKICAITGLCKNSIAVTQVSENEHLKRKGSRDDGSMMCGEDAIANVMNQRPSVKKKRSFRQDSVEDGDTDMDILEEYDQEKAWNDVTGHNEPSYGAQSYCGCNGSPRKAAAYQCCGLHY